MRPAAQLLSFCFAKKKVTKEKGDPTGRVPPLRCGQPVMLGRGAALPNSLRSLRSLRSNSGSESVYASACFAAPAPLPALLGTARRGVKSIRAIAALGLRYFSLSLGGRVGVRADQFKNHSCSRLPDKRWRHFFQMSRAATCARVHQKAAEQAIPLAARAGVPPATSGVPLHAKREKGGRRVSASGGCHSIFTPASRTIFSMPW